MDWSVRAWDMHKFLKNKNPPQTSVSLSIPGMAVLPKGHIRIFSKFSPILGQFCSNSVNCSRTNSVVVDEKLKCLKSVAPFLFTFRMAIKVKDFFFSVKYIYTEILKTSFAYC